MKNPNIEAKPAYATAAVFVVQTVFALAGHYHWFTPPPPGLILAVATAAAAVAGWLAPHTSRPKILTPAETAALDKALAGSRPVTYSFTSPASGETTVTSAVPGLSDAERRRAEDLRLTHAPGTPSFYPYPGETSTATSGTVRKNDPPAQPPASTP